MNTKTTRTLIIFLLFGLSTGFAAPRFELRYSIPLAVFQFVDNLSANAPPNPYKNCFEASSYNTPAYKKLIASYDSLTIDYGYEYAAYPYGQKIGGSTESLLKKGLVNSKSISEFKLAALGVIPNSDLFKLCAILTAFGPVYQKVIYQPYGQQFQNQLNALAAMLQTGRFSRYFEVGQRFYGGVWDDNIPFLIAVFPLPGTLHFSATAFYNNAQIAVPVGLKDKNKLLSVMMHEIFHVLYDEEPLSLKQATERAFVSNQSKNSRYAYLLLNEALATSLGNGYVYGQLNGRLDTGRWYNRKYTNLAAKAIYPLVEKYIQSGRCIDSAFVNSYISLFDRSFSGWLNEKDFVLTDRYLLSDNADDFNVIDQQFPYHSMTAYDRGVTIANIQKMKPAPITKVVIISKDNIEKLGLLKQQFSELSGWQPDGSSDFCYMRFLNDKTWLIVFNDVHKTTEQQLQELSIR